MKLFDEFDRTDSAFQGRVEQDFDFLNRSADPRFRAICTSLEAWFAKFPDEKKPDVRGRFRENDGPHSGVLLELITHEFLNAIGTNVKVEPDLNGLTPDFEAVVDCTSVLFECTVVHPPNARVGADKREAAIKKAIDVLDTGRFTLGTRFVKHGPGQPSGKRFRREIKEWLVTLDPGDLKINERRFSLEGWQVGISAYPLKAGVCKQKEDRSIGVEIDAGMVTAGPQIQDALEKKAEKYKASRLPYIIVVSHRFGRIAIQLQSIFDNSVIDALFGGRKWLIPRYFDFSRTPARETPSFDGFFGSRENPRNHRVSAVLFKRQTTLTSPSIPEQKSDMVPPWVLYHHPWTERPIEHGVFPFATDVYLVSSLDQASGTYMFEPKQDSSSCTLWGLLDLPIIGRDEYPSGGGMWEAIVG